MKSTIAERVRILKQALIFSGLGESELAALAEFTAEREFGAGEFVFWEGDPPEWFYIVAAGRIKAVKQATTGKEVIIAFFGQGEMFGEVAVFENRPYPASSQTLTETRVLAIKRQDFIGFLARQPQVALRIIDVLSGRLRESQGRLRDMAGERVEQRLARILLMLAVHMGKELPFTRQEIADMAGTTVETAIRFMSRLKDGGIIISERGKIIVVDEEKLRVLGEGAPIMH